MENDVPPTWRRERCQTYTPADSDRPMQYVTYVHESGDLRLRIAPASLDGDDRPGYTIRATRYPGLEFSESETIRRVLRFSRCDALAGRFMSLFSTTYDGPADLEDAVEYARARTSASDAYDAPVEVDEDDRES